MGKKNLLHLQAPGNWINDPNGFIYYRGKYHLFYQHFPYAPQWGTMHWGHAVSEDFVHWEHQDIAIFPTQEYDRNGIFSGSALEKDGCLYLYYSAVRYLETQKGNIHAAHEDRFETSQALLISPDGESFDNWGGKTQIIPVLEDKELGDPVHTRDPKVWKDGEYYYMVLGSTCNKKAARVLVFRSADGKEWEYASQCRKENYGWIIECPDLFSIEDTYIFTGCPVGIGEEGPGYHEQAVYAMADFQRETGELQLPDTYTYMDWGLDFYASQSNVDEEGRRVVIGWMRMPKPVTEETEKPWSGILSQPRVMELRDGKVYFRVHPYVDRCFRRELSGTKGLDVTRPYRIQTELHEGERLDIGGYIITLEGGCVKGDRSRVFDGIKGVRLAGATPEIGSSCHLDVFVSPHLIEVFVNDGEYVLSHVVYGLGSEVKGNYGKIFVEGQADKSGLCTDEIWKLETNIDDCSGETMGYLMGKLLDAGARDVSYIPIFMKKNRPAYQLNVICDEKTMERLERLVFEETTTIGIRRMKLERSVLARTIRKVETSLGQARVKVCCAGGRERWYPEYEDVVRLASEAGLTYQEAYRVIREECEPLARYKK